MQIILAHNYQIEEIQEVADFVGDSLGLAYKAEETDADVIVFLRCSFYGRNCKNRKPKQNGYFTRS